MPEDDGLILAEIDPGAVRRIHFVGVAGTGMGSFAGMLKAAGYAVTGSDQNVFPPMSDMLKAWGIPVLTPYSPANLDAAKPDLVIIGNVIRRVNPVCARRKWPFGQVTRWSVTRRGSCTSSDVRSASSRRAP